MAATWQVRAGLGLGLTLSNGIGIAVVYLLSVLVIPMPAADRDFLLEPSNILLAAAYVVVFGSIGTFQAWRVLHPVVVMLRPGDEPGDDDRRDVLAAPRRIFLFQGLLWGVASVLILLQFTRYSFALAFSIFLVVALAGWTTTSLTYLLSERALRPVARRVLQGGFPERMWVRSVASRTMFAWALGTGATVLGIVFTGAIALIDQRSTTVAQLAVTVTVLGGIVLLVGGMSSLVAAQASSEPIATLREAIARVEDGDLDVRVPIYDSTEIGLLQAGFNQMVQGLAEREEMRDIFGRHVGADVAKAALDGGAKLGGEVREVAVLFVDIVGSTGLAENEDPEEVVTLLNRFFEVVIDVVHEHEGWINKFAGDAALAIWGAPASKDDQSTSALSAARVLTTRLREEVPELRAGIGVSCGRVLAGNVGAVRAVRVHRHRRPRERGGPSDRGGQEGLLPRRGQPAARARRRRGGGAALVRARPAPAARTQPGDQGRHRDRRAARRRGRLRLLTRRGSCPPRRGQARPRPRRVHADVTSR